MNNEDALINDDDLHAYVDGQLDAARQAQVETWLNSHPHDAARVVAYRQQNDLLHTAFDATLAEGVPARLRQKQRPRTLQRVAMAATLVLGLTGGWVARELTLSQPPAPAFNLPAQAALAHVVYAQEVLHPVEVGADQQEHLIKWLSKRLNIPVHAPQLQASGYQLEGGRLLPAGDGPAAQFMYRNALGQRLSLYLRTGLTDNTDTAFRYAEQGRVSTFYWVDHEVAYALSGELERAQLLAVAEAVYHALN